MDLNGLLAPAATAVLVLGVLFGGARVDRAPIHRLGFWCLLGLGVALLARTVIGIAFGAGLVAASRAEAAAGVFALAAAFLELRRSKQSRGR
ncbi:MAG: hypothetical protein ACP5NF_03305 [Thermoanaerobaculum sp.]